MWINTPRERFVFRYKSDMYMVVTVKVGYNNIRYKDIDFVAYFDTSAEILSEQHVCYSIMTGEVLLLSRF